jgi:hypothetical protein
MAVTETGLSQPSSSTSNGLARDDVCAGTGSAMSALDLAGTDEGAWPVRGTRDGVDAEGVGDACEPHPARDCIRRRGSRRKSSVRTLCVRPRIDWALGGVRGNTGRGIRVDGRTYALGGRRRRTRVDAPSVLAQLSPPHSRACSASCCRSAHASSPWSQPSSSSVHSPACCAAASVPPACRCRSSREVASAASAAARAASRASARAASRAIWRLTSILAASTCASTRSLMEGSTSTHGAAMGQKSPSRNPYRTAAERKIRIVI